MSEFKDPADATRRTFIKSVAGVVGASAISSIAPDIAQAETPARPNILILHSHDLGRFLHCYGIKTAHTPNLDRLASEGVLFERSFATAPQCSPSRASIFTGRYPHQNGVLGLTHSPFFWDLHPNEMHLGQLLKQAGYRTAGVGVMHETHSGAKRCGIDEYVKKDMAIDVADETIKFLRHFAAEPGKPFYMAAGTREPHRLNGFDPNADKGFLGKKLHPDDSDGVTIPGYLRDTPSARQEVAELQGAVHHVDTQMGRILDVLHETGLDKTTLVIFTTDHGIALPRAKCSVYDPGHETAFILRYPARKGWYGGKRETALVSNIDYLPTLLEVAGAPIPANVQGKSFAPVLDGKTEKHRDRVFFQMTYHEYYDPRRAVRTEKHKLIVNYSAAPAFMDPSQSWRPRCDTVTPACEKTAYHKPFELYDIEKDPLEQNDISADPAYATVLTDLRKSLHQEMEETGDPILKGAIIDPIYLRSTAWMINGNYDASADTAKEG